MHGGSAVTLLSPQAICSRKGGAVLQVSADPAGFHAVRCDVAAVDGLVPEEVIVRFAKAFGGVAHRIEFVRELDGVRYYNDSIASSPSRTIAGLKSFHQKVILIAGGYDKHIPYDDLGPYITERVKHLILTGETADKIQAAVLAAPNYKPEVPHITRCENLENAVNAAYGIACSGDVVQVLLSISLRISRSAAIALRLS